MQDNHPDDTMIRFRVDSDDIALLLPERHRGTQDPATPWLLVRVQYGPARSVGDEFFRGQTWTDPVPLREVAATTMQGDRSPVRRLAGKYLRFSIGNGQPHKDIQRAVYADIRFALGDHPTEVYDDLAASRVIDVTPTESLLDGVDVVLSSARLLHEHIGFDDLDRGPLERTDRELLDVATEALAELHDRLQTRAARVEETKTP